MKRGPGAVLATGFLVLLFGAAILAVTLAVVLVKAASCA